MAKHKTITIKVSYDDAHPIPRDKDLEMGILAAVGVGLLNDTAEECLVESWEVSVTDTNES